MESGETGEKEKAARLPVTPFDSAVVKNIYEKLYNMPITVYSFSLEAQKVFDIFVEHIAK